MLLAIPKLRQIRIPLGLSTQELKLRHRIGDGHVKLTHQHCMLLVPVERDRRLGHDQAHLWLMPTIGLIELIVLLLVPWKILERNRLALGISAILRQRVPPLADALKHPPQLHNQRDNIYVRTQVLN